MVKWLKLTSSQYLGFWAIGLLLFALQEVPYLVMPLFHLEANPIMNMEESSVFLDLCEKVLGSLCIALMVFLVHKDAVTFSVNSGNERLFFLLAVLVLLLNYVGWGLYFSGRQSVGVMLFFIVLLPPLYYIMIGLWRNNTPLAVVGSIFLIVHFTHVLGNLKS